MRRFSFVMALVAAGLACWTQPLAADSSVDKVSAIRAMPTVPAIPVSMGAADQHTAPTPTPRDFDLGGEPPCEGDNCNRKARWSVFGDYLYLSTRQSLPYGQIKDGVGPDNVPVGPVGVIDPDYSSGFRVGGSLGIGPRTELALSFLYYDNHSSSALAVPVGQPFVIQALTTFPATEAADFDSLSASAESDIALWIADADFKYSLASSDCFNLNFILGGRYAKLGQDFHAEYVITGTTDVTTKVEFDGAGPRVGLDGTYSIRQGAFLYSRGTASFLLGHFGATYLQENVFAGTQAQTDFRDDRLVTVLDFEAGIGWRSSKGRVSVMAGYMASVWLNTLTTSSWIEGVRANSFTTNGDNLRDSLTFDGLFFRAEFRY